MTLQTSLLGRAWLGEQSAKGTAATTFYGYKANLVGLTPQQALSNIGALVGGSLIRPGSIKTAAWSAGALIMPPALDDQIGWLFKAFAGSVSSVDNADSTYTHYFPSGADDTQPNLYLTARRKVPGTSALYEQMEDMRVYRLLFGFPAANYATLRAEFVGGTFSKPDGSGWTFSAADETSVPVSSVGTFELPDSTVVSTERNTTVDITAVVPPLQQVQVGGSYFPYDFPVLERVVSIQFNYLWENPTLYNSLLYNGTDFEPVVYSSDFHVTVQSPGYITGALRYKLEFYAKAVDWTLTPIQLRGNGLIDCTLQGALKDSASGQDWYLAVTNGTADYASA
jgi:hypothetical protein